MSEEDFFDIVSELSPRRKAKMIRKSKFLFSPTSLHSVVKYAKVKPTFEEKKKELLHIMNEIYSNVIKKGLKSIKISLLIQILFFGAIIGFGILIYSVPNFITLIGGIGLQLTGFTADINHIKDLINDYHIKKSANEIEFEKIVIKTKHAETPKELKEIRKKVYEFLD